MSDIKEKDTFGSRLRNARKKVWLPQDQLGFELGVSKSAVSSWECDRDRPSFDMLPRLQLALRISLDELICGSIHPNTTQELPQGPAPVLNGHRPEGVAADPSEVELLRRFRELPKMKRLAVLDLLR